MANPSSLMEQCLGVGQASLWLHSTTLHSSNSFRICWHGFFNAIPGGWRVTVCSSRGHLLLLFRCVPELGGTLAFVFLPLTGPSLTNRLAITPPLSMRIKKTRKLKMKTLQNVIFEQVVIQSTFAPVKGCLFGQVEALKTLRNTWKYMLSDSRKESWQPRPWQWSHLAGPALLQKLQRSAQLWHLQTSDKTLQGLLVARANVSAFLSFRTCSSVGSQGH